MNPESESQPENKNLKHSGYGIASFVISIVNVMLIIIFYKILRNPDSFSGGDEGWGALALYGIVSIIAVVLVGSSSLLGLTLGIISFYSQSRKKVFGILGCVFNGLLILIFVVMLFLLLTPRAGL